MYLYNIKERCTQYIIHHYIILYHLLLYIFAETLNIKILHQPDRYIHNSCFVYLILSTCIYIVSDKIYFFIFPSNNNLSYN